VRCIHHGERRAIDAQFHMESVAAIVPGAPPKNGYPKTPSASHGRQFAVPTTGSQSVPEMLFAFPEGILSNDPAVDSNASACPESAEDDNCRDRQSPAAARPESDTSAPPQSARSKPAKAKAPKKVVRAESNVAATAPGPVEKQSNISPSPSSSNRLPADKRSCRALAGDGPLF